MPPFPNMTFDLDLWPTDLKINRDHLLIKDYLPTKFEASGAKPSWVISCTRLRETDIPTDGPTDGPTDRPTCATQYAPPFSKGGINMWKCDNEKKLSLQRKSQGDLYGLTPYYDLDLLYLVNMQWWIFLRWFHCSIQQIQAIMWKCVTTTKKCVY